MARSPAASTRRGSGRGTKTPRGGGRADAPRTTASRAARKATPARKAAPAGQAVPRRRAAAAQHQLVATPPSAESPQWTATLADGTQVMIRPVHKEDAALERAFIEGLSPQSRRLRFLGQMSEPSEALIRQLTDLDYRRDMGFIALVEEDGSPREIGASQYSTSADGQSCECAVVVSDAWHNKGVGTLLMRHLIEVARSRGLRTMVSIDAASNVEMRDLARFLGFRRSADRADPTQVVHTLDLQA